MQFSLYAERFNELHVFQLSAVITPTEQIVMIWLRMPRRLESTETNKGNYISDCMYIYAIRNINIVIRLFHKLSIHNSPVFYSPRGNLPESEGL